MMLITKIMIGYVNSKNLDHVVYKNLDDVVYKNLDYSNCKI